MTEYQYPLTGHALVNATHSDKYNQVKRIIESGIHPDDYTGNSMPALVCSCANGNYEITEYLLSKGANPNLYTADKRSPLKSAANIGHLEITRLLLKANADPNYEKEGEVALTLACDQYPNKELIKLLLPVTDKKYYQKAYDYSTDVEIRNMIKEYDSNLIEPSSFGGPKYKQNIHYETPPTDPLLREYWFALDLYIKTVGQQDPNRAMLIVMTKCSLCDEPTGHIGEDGKLYICGFVREQLLRLDHDVLKEKYNQVYEVLINYKEDSDDEEDDEEEEEEDEEKDLTAVNEL